MAQSKDLLQDSAKQALAIVSHEFSGDVVARCEADMRSIFSRIATGISSSHRVRTAHHKSHPTKNYCMY